MHPQDRSQYERVAKRDQIRYRHEISVWRKQLRDYRRRNSSSNKDEQKEEEKATSATGGPNQPIESSPKKNRSSKTQAEHQLTQSKVGLEHKEEEQMKKVEASSPQVLETPFHNEPLPCPPHPKFGLLGPTLSMPLPPPLPISQRVSPLTTVSSLASDITLNHPKHCRNTQATQKPSSWIASRRLSVDAVKRDFGRTLAPTTPYEQHGHCYLSPTRPQHANYLPHPSSHDELASNAAPSSFDYRQNQQKRPFDTATPFSSPRRTSSDDMSLLPDIIDSQWPSEKQGDEQLGHRIPFLEEKRTLRMHCSRPLLSSRSPKLDSQAVADREWPGGSASMGPPMAVTHRRQLLFPSTAERNCPMGSPPPRRTGRKIGRDPLSMYPDLLDSANTDRQWPSGVGSSLDTPLAPHLRQPPFPTTLKRNCTAMEFFSPRPARQVPLHKRLDNTTVMHGDGSQQEQEQQQTVVQLVTRASRIREYAMRNGYSQDKEPQSLRPLHEPDDMNSLEPYPLYY